MSKKAKRRRKLDAALERAAADSPGGIVVCSDQDVLRAHARSERTEANGGPVALSFAGAPLVDDRGRPWWYCPERDDVLTAFADGPAAPATPLPDRGLVRIRADMAAAAGAGLAHFSVSVLDMREVLQDPGGLTVDQRREVMQAVGHAIDQL